ncbi:MAG: hypothetical protein O2800_04365 [Planctomycetota bacterium]|nr:hypothetical protein [Planctomycetota bacterium]
MLRFFRENEKIAKWIIVVGLVLLLISWLAFDFTSNSLIGDFMRGRQTWAQLDGEDISISELDRVQRQLRVLEAIGSPVAQRLDTQKNPEHWFLLVQEATNAGLVGPKGDGMRLIAARAAQSATQVDPGIILGNLMGTSGLSQDDVLETLAEEQGVMRLVTLVGGAGATRVSKARLTQEASRRLLGVSGRVMFIDAGLESGTPFALPSDEQLASHLKTYGESAPGEGKNGFGYRLPNRVKYEWMSIAASGVTSAIASGPDLSNIALRKYFMENPVEFLGNAALSAEKPTFEYHRDAVRTALLTKLTNKRMAEVAKFATDRFAMQLRGLPRKDSSVTLPADWATQRLSFAALATELATRFAIPQPSVIEASDAWSAPAELDTVPGLGTSITNAFGTQGVRPSQLALALTEFGGHATLVAQAGVAFPVFTTASGDLFIARITEAQPSHAPESIETVRADLVRDVSRLTRYASLETELPSIQERAAADFDALAPTYNATITPFLDLRLSNPQFLQYGVEFGQPIPGVGTAPELMTRMVEEAMKLPAGAPATDTPVAQRTFAVAMPERLAVAVVQIDGISPMNTAQLAEANKGNGLKQLVAAQGGKDPLSPFTFAAMKVRMHFINLSAKE